MLSLVRWLMAQRRLQEQLYRSVGTQGLTWDVILLVAEAELSNVELSVSDICVSVGASKSTTLKLIGKLVADDVIQKRRKLSDSRRHLLTLSETFGPRFEAAITELIDTYPKDGLLKVG